MDFNEWFFKDLFLRLEEGTEYARVYPRMMWVYAFKMDNGTVKIGASGDVALRARTIAGSSGHEVLAEHHTFLAPERLAYDIERQCHETFKDRRAKKGEYFNISFEEACCELDKHNTEIIRVTAYLLDLQKAYEAKIEIKGENSANDLFFRYCLENPNVIIEVATNLKTRLDQLIEFATELKRKNEKIAQLQKEAEELKKRCANNDREIAANRAGSKSAGRR